MLVPILRAARGSLALLLLLALAAFGLFALERAGTAPAVAPITTPAFELSNHRQGKGPDQPPPACEKSQGKAPQKNPNCPGFSRG